MMEPDEIIEGKKLIADWLFEQNAEIPDVLFVKRLFSVELKNTDYSWLMPVVSKLENKYDYTITIQKGSTTVKAYDGDCYCVLKLIEEDQEVKINHIFAAVVAAIKH